MNAMNVSRLSKRDLERLSAYLDGELSARQTTRLEARLWRESTLRAALDELREAAWLLRSMPEASPPRSFTLTPEMVATPKPHGVYPVLKIASALASAAFVLVVGFDLFSSSQAVSDFALSGAQRAVMEVASEDSEAGEGEYEPGVEALPADAMDNIIAEPAEPALEAFAPDSGVGEEAVPTASPVAELAEAPAAAEPEAMQDVSGDAVEADGELEGDAVSADEHGKQGEVSDQDDALGDGVTATFAAPLEDKAAEHLIGEERDRWEFPQIEPLKILEIALAVLCIVLITSTLLFRFLCAQGCFL